jgi:hypothetical protein
VLLWETWPFLFWSIRGFRGRRQPQPHVDPSPRRAEVVATQTGIHMPRICG